MSMQMAKRVSLSRPWGLNRSPHEIEPLGSTSSLPCADWTCWLGQPNAPEPARSLDGRHGPSVQLSPLISNGREHTRQRLSYDRTHQSMTGRTLAAPGQHKCARHQTMTGRTDPFGSMTSGHFQRASRAPKPRPDASDAP
jgi:hypothetical protein